jgi:hypothetical protein
VAFVLVCAGTLVPTAPQQVQRTPKKPQTDQAEVIAYAKQLDVSRLDPTLPKRPLEEWMRDSGALANASSWQVSDCGQMPDPRKPEPLPLCVDFRIVHGDCSGRPCAVIWGKILVGTLRDRVTGGPEFWGMMLLTGSAYDYKGFDAADSLSELPRLLEKLKRY